MKKLFSLIAAVFLVWCMALPSFAGDFSAGQMKKMETFLSNFTEVRMTDFSAKDILDPSHPYEMIRFAIWHHHINTAPRTIKPLNSPYGDATIDGKYVRESLKRYFDYDLKSLPSIREPEGQSGCQKCRPVEYHSDGLRYYFYKADAMSGGDPAYYAKVTQAEKLPDGNVQMNS